MDEIDINNRNIIFQCNLHANISYFLVDIFLLMMTIFTQVKQFHCHLLFALFLLQREDPDRESLRLLTLLLHSAKWEEADLNRGNRGEEVKEKGRGHWELIKLKKQNNNTFLPLWAFSHHKNAQCHWAQTCQITWSYILWPLSALNLLEDSICWISTNKLY